MSDIRWKLWYAMDVCFTNNLVFPIRISKTHAPVYYESRMHTLYQEIVNVSAFRHMIFESFHNTRPYSGPKDMSHSVRQTSDLIGSIEKEKMVAIRCGTWSLWNYKRFLRNRLLFAEISVVKILLRFNAASDRQKGLDTCNTARFHRNRGARNKEKIRFLGIFIELPNFPDSSFAQATHQYLSCANLN
jgi:hypothetical protein